jgi:hypothetical protein
MHGIRIKIVFNVLMKMPWDILVHVWWHDLSVTGRVLTACTGVCCQNVNKWLWNAVFGDEQKFVSDQENGNLGKAKMEV